MAHPSHSSSLIKGAFAHYFGLSGITDAKLDEIIDDISQYHKVRIISERLKFAYTFELDLRIPGSEFRDLVERQMSKAAKAFTARTELDQPYLYAGPFTPTIDQEIELAEELRKVKERFYEKVQRDKRGNRLTKEEVEKYNKLEDFGKF